MGLRGVGDDPLDGLGVLQDAVDVGAGDARLLGEFEEGAGFGLEEGAGEGAVGAGGLEVRGEGARVGLGDGYGAGCRRGECLRSSVISSLQVTSTV